MELTQHTEKIGKTLQYKVQVPSSPNKMMVDVKVVDVKFGWGKVKYKITPVRGSGSIWIVAPETIGGD